MEGEYWRLDDWERWKRDRADDEIWRDLKKAWVEFDKKILSKANNLTRAMGSKNSVR